MNMNILLWSLFGALTGIVTYMLDNRNAKRGIGTAVIIGILGAVAGGMVANVLFGIAVTKLTTTSLMLASASAMIFLLAGRVLRKT